MQKGPLFNLKLGWNEVVLHRGVDLHDVSSSSANVIIHLGRLLTSETILKVKLLVYLVT